MKILIRNENNLCWEKGDMQTSSGVIKEQDIINAVNSVKAHSGKEFIVYNANNIDKLRKIKHGPQTLLLKDIGYIIANSGVNKNSIVLDAGSGCGLLAIFMAQTARKVISYDINQENLKIAQHNVNLFNLDNIELKNKDIYEDIEENIDILTLDVPEPWRVPLNKLRNGATIIVYLPTITQVIEFYKKENIVIEKTIELLEREWYIEGKKVRPKSDMQGHTAFIIVARKL